MKKLFCFLLAVLLVLTVTVEALADESPWGVQWLPEIFEADEAVPVTIEKIIPVGLGWDSVFHDETIDTYISVPHENNIFAVILTDGFHFIHGRLEEIGEGMLFVTFKTEEIRLFLNKGAYLILVGCTE